MTFPLLRTTCLLLDGLFTGPSAANSATTSYDAMNTNPKSFIGFFSRADENYAVGNIEKGNTHLIADIIAEQTGADLFASSPSPP